MTDPAERDLSTADVARMLRVSASTISNWADAGKLAHYRTAGGYRRFREADVDTFAAQHFASPAVEPKAS